MHLVISLASIGCSIDSECVFQVHMFSDGRDMKKCHSFCKTMTMTMQTPWL